MKKSDLDSSTTLSVRGPQLIPEGAFFFPVEGFEAPRDLGFLLLPRFTLLAFSAALDPLRIANQLAQKPLYRWSVFSETGDPVKSSSGIEINVHGSLKKPSKGSSSTRVLR